MSGKPPHKPLTPEELGRYIEAGWANIARSQERQPPDWVESNIALIDALRAVIWSETAEGEECLHEGHIDKAAFDKGMISTRQLQMILRQRETYEVCPSLHGLIKDKQGTK